MTQDSLGIYLSIPFCKAKCTFCNFASGVFAEDRLAGYVDHLCAEVREGRPRAEALQATLPEYVDTIYFGGGTPSLLTPPHLRQIFATLHDAATIAPDAEITLEAAPGQITGETLDAAQDAGVNRVSLGVQSFIDAESTAVGRLHNGVECLAEIARLRSAGIPHLSLDLIAGLPHQTAASWQYSVEQAIASGVDHVSVYLLEVDEDSRLGREALAGGRRYHAGALPAEDETADWYEAACARLATAGLAQYEISNFARPGFASRHNLKYWHRKPYLGVGLDAHSMLLSQATGSLAVRWANSDEMDAYLDRPASIFPLLDKKQEPAVDYIDQSQAFEESLFLGLRLNEGVDLEHLRVQFGSSRIETALDVLVDIESAGLVRHIAGRVSLTPAGRLASNEVFSRLLAA